MTSAELRKAFLEFFEQKGHRIVASSSLVPANDPTLLFTNAGMVQFKDVFLGKDTRDYNRATSSQRCVRAGGKHNDLENVGYTARHHTFFEMLGNFSFGDYFKQEAIEFAWEFMTQTLRLEAERIWVTVYEEDDEAADIWMKIPGTSPDRFSRMGKKDNFWSMGDTGPCGPCSELFYDHGEDVPGGPPGSPDEDGDRYVEIWNLVFMQFDRDADGNMTPLPKPSVDTGMGLERVAAVMQGVHSNYETDLFAPLVKSAADIAGMDDLQADENSSSLNVIADHIRACTFLVVDDVQPSNEGRGYVLRRIIRRAIRHGYMLGIKEPFFHKLVGPLANIMGDAYPELSKGQAHAEKILLKEEERFAETLDQGMRLLEQAISDMDGDTIPGDTVFKLYDTFGFPVDLTADIAREKGLNIDQSGFETAMDGQRERARAASRFSAQDDGGVVIDAETGFTGYDATEGSGKVIALISDGDQVDSIASGQKAQVVLDKTPFYAESGGQVGDAGTLSNGDTVFVVHDTQKSGNAFLHIGEVTKGKISVGGALDAHVDAQRRAHTVLNHSATHLLHAALRKVLGDHVTQKGSLVAPDRLRFDFSHYEPVTQDQLDEIEALVNHQVQANVPAEVKVLPYNEAIKEGALALCGEKYGDKVRVLRLGEFSTELCGGTHVNNTGDIGVFRITHETGIASGVRRIEALTGDGAMTYIDKTEQTIRDLSALLKSGRDELADKVRQLVDKHKKLEKEVQKLRSQLASGQGGDATADAVEIKGIKVLVKRIDGADAKTLRDVADRYRDKLGSSVVVLGAADGDKVRLVAGVSKDKTDTIKAGDVIKPVAEMVGGKGGGRADFAQAGGNDASQLDAALKGVPAWVEQHLG